MKRFILFLSLLLSFFFSSAQPSRHYYNNTWLRLSFRDHLIKRKIDWDLMLQHRRQAYSSDYNIIERTQLQNYWLWFHYSLKKFYTVSTSPFCYFETRPLSDLDARPVKEWRWCLRLEKKFYTGDLICTARLSQEFRYRNLYDANNYTGNFRTRFLLRMEKRIYNRDIYLVLSNETMFQYGDAVKNSASYFDQNRSFIGFSGHIAKHVKADIGYAFIVQERASGHDQDMQNSIWINLGLENIFSRFKKKELQPTQ